MKLLIVCFIFLTTHSLSQEFDVTAKTTISSTVSESSGLIFLENRLITHNDSGGSPLLYELDTLSGMVSRTVFIENATNVDWEDLCFDTDYIYVGDFGNNAGTRTDLKIYKILINDYLALDTVTADTISFSYSDQTSFESDVFSTNYDAEAIIAIGDSLYLFSKNWENNETNVYSISKEPGTYNSSIIDNFNTEGLVTGADYDPIENEILLTGYTFFTIPFVFLIRDLSGTNFSEALLKREAIVLDESNQVEAIASIGNFSYYISSESSMTGDGILHLLKIRGFSGINDLKLNSNPTIYPNPTSSILQIDTTVPVNYFIYALNGKLISFGKNSNQIDLSSLESGSYLLVLKDENNLEILSRQIIKN